MLRSHGSLAKVMHPDTAMGIIAELNDSLSEGWVPIRETDRIRIQPPQTAVNASNFNQLLQSEARRIARQIAYSDFVSRIERKPRMGCSPSTSSFKRFNTNRSGSLFEVCVSN